MLEAAAVKWISLNVFTLNNNIEKEASIHFYYLYDIFCVIFQNRWYHHLLIITFPLQKSTQFAEIGAS